MTNKDIGKLYIRLNGGLYKIARIKAGSDGSIYIATPLGVMHKGHGVDGNKFTYHPDGKSWLTSELQLKNIDTAEVDNVLRRLEGWKSSGLGLKNGKLYTRDFDVKVPLADVQEILNLKYAISYKDIHTLNVKEMMAEVTDQCKIGTATVIDVRQYKHLTLRFYVVGRAYLDDGLQKLGLREKFYFDYPKLKLYVVVALTDEWTGEKKAKQP